MRSSARAGGGSEAASCEAGREEMCEVDGGLRSSGDSAEFGSFPGLVDADEAGYLIAEKTKTSHAGIFAAGDVRTRCSARSSRQTADGANAITAVQEYLLKL